MDRLSIVDLINLAVETPQAPMHIGAVAVLDGRALRDAGGLPPIAEIRSDLDRRLDRVPHLRRIIHRLGPFAGRPLWIDDPGFRIERHVHQVQLDGPGDQEALLRLAGQRLTRPLDRAHPLWRMWFVTGLASGDLAVIFVMHHVMADGLAALHLLTAFLDPPGSADAASCPVWSAKARPRWWELVRDNLRSRRTAGRERTRRPTPWSELLRSRLVPRTSLNAPVGSHRRIERLCLDLATARQVAHHQGCKVNDVVLDLAAGGIRALLTARGEAVDRLELTADVVVSLRDPGQSAEPGNRTGGFTVRLPIDEVDPLRRLNLIGARSAAAKIDQISTTGNTLLMGLARVGLLRRFSRRQRLTNLIESNVAGPPSTVDLLGVPVLDLIPLGSLAGNLAISFLALSYAGRLGITVQADADHFRDLPVLLSGMDEEWAMLAGLVSEGLYM
jgi:diacylglycerol O-acyltransferase / wax synthase